MADKTIGSLPQAADVGDDSLFVLEQQGEAMKASGAQWKGYAQQAVSQYVSAAQGAAKQAAQSAQSAAESLENIGDSVEQAQQAAEAAQTAQEAVENLGVSGETLAAGQPVEVVKTVSETGVVTLTFRIPQGIQGERGPQGNQGPQGISVTAATVLSDGTLQLTLSNGTTVNAGNVIGPQGHQGERGEQGPQGVSIVSVERTSGTGAPGTTDTYTITFSDDSTSTFHVYNGANGTGTGDFMASGIVPMTGNLQMGGNIIQNVGEPVSNTDAARLQEVNSKADPGTAFTVSLPASGWSANQQTVTDARFVSSGYVYIITADSDTYAEYTAAVIYAGDVTTNGQITFYCSEAPSSDVVANVLKQEVA